MRVTDPTWRDFLDHLRHGRVQEHHVRTLKELVVGHPKAPPIDFDVPLWSDACLVIPRHAVRKLWNEAAVRKWCEETGELELFVCQAENTIKGRQLTLRERYALAAKAQTSGRRKRKDLAENIELGREMKV
jgi:hypothetical protein